ncbi:MAG: Gfo/Idh/MocA family oxidoreductase [Planctomycetes bacterium]|nr:Gfo/Idh/MocA family oxidoreductase [Planctomycetota bacterium]
MRIGLIGTGKKKERGDRFGFAMAYRHADGYSELESCEMVACADIVQENTENFAQTYDIGEDGVFLDYKQMLDEMDLDVVSICTWMHLHEQMVLDCIDAGVQAIHCEKPMADTWGGAKRMAEAAEKAGVQLTFNHQRRYGKPFTMAKEMLDNGEIGELIRLECGAGNLYDTGTHFIDMFSFFNGEVPAKWVLGQIDYSKENFVFGSHNENQQVVLTEYQNGVFGLIMTGVGTGPVGCVDKLVGTEGTIEVGVQGGPPIRYKRAGESDWTEPDTGGESIHGPRFIERAVADVISCFLEGRKCQLDASNALIATEIIFGAYESSRRRGLVEFPLDIEDNPLASMVEQGKLKPEPDEEARQRGAAAS